MGKGSKTATTTQVNTVPEYVSQSQQTLLDAALRMTAPWLSPQSQLTANLTPDQLAAFDLARTRANAWTNWESPTLYRGNVPQVTQAQYAGSAWTPTQIAAATAAEQQAPERAYVSQQSGANILDVGAGQVGGDKIRALVNPYASSVLDPTINLMRRELGKTQAQIGAQRASEAAFGGARRGIEAAETNRAFEDQVAKTTADLMYQGWDRATATALANEQQAQAARLYNAQAQDLINRFNVEQLNRGAEVNAAAQNAVNQFNALQRTDVNKYNVGQENALNQFNAAQLNDIMKYNAGQQNALNLANAAQANQMAESAANRDLAATGVQNTLLNDQQRRQLQALQTLLQSGTQQQQQQQQVLNQPMEMLKLLIQATPGNTGSTQTRTEPVQTGSPLSALGGLVSIGGGLFGPLGLFPGFAWPSSDRRDKTDIKKLGRDEETGLDMYSYRYKGDPKNTMKVIGPMAQDIEKKYPGTVREIAGHKVIDTRALRSVLGVNG